MPTRRRALARAGSPARALVEPGHTVFGTPLGHSPAGRSRERRSPRARSRTSSRMGQRDLSMNAAAGRVAIELGLPPELSISDLVAAAAVELGLPTPRDTEQGLLEVCDRLRIETDWRQDFDQAGLYLSPLARPTTPGRTREDASPPAAVDKSESPSHLHEDWFTSRGFSPSRSPRTSPARGSGYRHEQKVDTRRMQNHSSPNARASESISVEVTGDVRGLSLAVVSLDISTDVDQVGQSLLVHGSASADQWYMKLKDAVRSVAFCEYAGSVGLRKKLSGSSTGSASRSRVVARQIKQQLESREHTLFKESAKHTKSTLEVTVDLRACSTRQSCDSLVFVLFDSSSCTAPDVMSHRCASNERPEKDLHRPTLAKQTQTAVSRNGCQGKMVEVTYASDVTAAEMSPYRGGIRVGGGFKHIRPPEIKSLDERLRAKEIRLRVGCNCGELNQDHTFTDTLSMSCVVESPDWTGAVLMYGQPQSVMWDQLVARVHARKEQRGALVIQAVCRQMLERQHFLAHNYIRDGYRHMAELRWELACHSFRSALSLHCIDSMREALNQALHSAEESYRRRELAREEVIRLLLTGNEHADAQEQKQAVLCYEAALAVQGIQDVALSAKLEHLRLEMAEGAQLGIMRALADRRAELETARRQARASLVDGYHRLANGEVQAATEAYQEAIQLAQTLQQAQDHDGQNEKLLHEILAAVDNAQKHLASSQLSGLQADM